jgi:type II secretory pathway pseudopilin PulG
MRSRRGRAGAFSRHGEISAPRDGPARLAAGAFTLIELLLVLSLIVVVGVAGWMTFGGWKSQTDFEEGVNRVESALRLARAESANLGLRLRIAFDANGGPPILLYEPSPLEAPEEFVPYVGCTWADVLDGGLALVCQCRLTDSSAYRPSGMGTGNSGEQAVLESLTFYPDGTSDSALVELRPPDEADTRRAIIELGGSDGVVRTWMADADTLADTYEQIHLEEYPDPNVAG